MIQPGRYRHYKGNDYEILGVARHSETEEEVVVYRALYGEGGLWVRPLTLCSLKPCLLKDNRVPGFNSWRNAPLHLRCNSPSQALQSPISTIRISAA